jgi:hypothetical protein
MVTPNALNIMCPDPIHNLFWLGSVVNQIASAVDLVAILFLPPNAFQGVDVAVNVGENEGFHWVSSALVICFFNFLLSFQ